MSKVKMTWQEALLKAASDEEQIEKFVERLIDSKSVQVLVSELTDYYLDRYIQLSKSREGRETLATIMEAEEFLLEEG